MVQVRLGHVIKANQAYIELKSLKRQSLFMDTLVRDKDLAFKRLLEANNLSHNLNKEYETIIKAERAKLSRCDEYANKIEFQNKQLTFQQGFLKIGTPIIAVAVGAAGFVVGYYIAKALP